MSLDNRKTLAEIDLDNLAFNFRSVRGFVGETGEDSGVVKADAYGHGAVECSKRLETAGADWFGVATIGEAVELRKARYRLPILYFRGYCPGDEDLLDEYDITPILFDLDSARALDRHAHQAGRIANVHIKIDTGMGRVGVPFQDASEFAEKFSNFRNLNVDGIMTHFASADDMQSDLTNEQMRRFANVVSIFHEKGFRPRVLDMANSPGAIGHPDSHATMIRAGGLLYGLGDDVLPSGIERPELRPVMSLRSKIAFLKTVPAGSGIGYGQTFTTSRESLIASVPIGYYDGYRRCLSNKARVLVKGRRVPLVGRISMDWITIDVTDVEDVKKGDEVVLIGSSENNDVKAAELARICDTISYEITCGISKRVPRIYRSEMM
jgi:alanine racemase